MCGTSLQGSAVVPRVLESRIANCSSAVLQKGSNFTQLVGMSTGFAGKSGGSSM